MLNPKLKQYLSQGYVMIGKTSHKIAINLGKGKDHTRSQLELYDKGIRVLRILKVLFTHITFDESSKPILWRITEEEVNALIACLVKIGELDQYPIYPDVLPNTKPVNLSVGQQGQAGQNGLNGNDANIIVRAKSGEDEIAVTSVIELGVKIYELDLQLYIQQLLLVTIPAGILFRIGNIVDVAINLTTTKGSKNITTLISTDADVDDILQPLINLITLNGISQPVVTILNVENIDSNTTFTFQINDGKTTVSAFVTVTFVYPYLFGISDTTTGFDYYTTLSKLDTIKSNRSFILNGINKYFWIGYDASYGTLNSIKDQSGLEKIADFTEVVDNVNSNGLDVDWSGKSYRFYRTTLKTTINNLPFSIIHN